MKCIKCGREISDGELFCAMCSRVPAHAPSAPNPPVKTKKAQPEKQSAPKSAARTKPQPSAHQPVKKTGSEQELPRKKPVKLIVSFILACMVIVALVAFIFTSWSDLTLQKTNLRVREADLALREQDADKFEKELSQLQEELVDANRTVDELEAENKDLKRQLSGTQSTVSQTQYDITAQQQELEKLATDNKVLGDQVDALEAQAGTLQTKVSELTTNNILYSQKADFMDSYVVFVNNDGSKYYHTYDCANFDRKSFWAYSRKLAESSGFSACLVCGG